MGISHLDHVLLCISCVSSAQETHLEATELCDIGQGSLFTCLEIVIF